MLPWRKFNLPPQALLLGFLYWNITPGTDVFYSHKFNLAACAPEPFRFQGFSSPKAIRQSVKTVGAEADVGTFQSHSKVGLMVGVLTRIQMCLICNRVAHTAVMFPIHSSVLAINVGLNIYLYVHVPCVLQFVTQFCPLSEIATYLFYI